MSPEKNKDAERMYILNVAQQFLQSRPRIFNPLSNENYFHTLCDSTGYNARCFYANLASDAEKFLGKFKGPSLQRIICASNPTSGDGYTLPPNGPVRVPMWLLGASTACLFATDGIGILRNVAAVSLVAAAYDLCYAKHHQGGVRPI